MGNTAFIRIWVFSTVDFTRYTIKKYFFQKFSSRIISVLEVILTVEVRKVCSVFQYYFLDDNVTTAVWPVEELLSLKNPK